MVLFLSIDLSVETAEAHEGAVMWDRWQNTKAASLDTQDGLENVKDKRIVRLGKHKRCSSIMRIALLYTSPDSPIVLKWRAAFSAMTCGNREFKTASLLFAIRDSGM
ncbi:hypothetical protein IF2G_01734 [Cordyceps javanica]|nr:hypothetical protein IF2G_01734 [Cordyceps javanica]